MAALRKSDMLQCKNNLLPIKDSTKIKGFRIGSDQKSTWSLNLTM